MNSQAQRIQAQFRLLLDKCGKTVPEGIELPKLLSQLGTLLQDQENQIESLKVRVNHLEKHFSRENDVL